MAIAVGTDPDLHGRARRGVRRGDVLAAVEGQPDGPAEGEGGAGHERVHDEKLRAERPAQRRRPDAHPGDRQAEDLGQLLADVEDALGRGGHRQDAVRFQPGGRGVRLDVALVDPVRAERRLDRHRRRRQCDGGIGLRVALAIDDVGRQVLVEQLRTLAPDRGVRRLGRVLLGVVTLEGQDRGDPGERAVRLHRRLEVGHDRQTFGVDDDVVDRVGRGRLGLGDDEGDGVTDEQRLFPGERLVHPHVVRPGDGQVRGGQDGDHAGHRECGRRVDAPDPGVGVDARHDPRVEQLELALVSRVARGASDLVLRVDTRSCHADEAGRRRSRRPPSSSWSRRDRAASARLSTIQPRLVKAGGPMRTAPW